VLQASLTVTSPLFEYSDIETIGWLGMWLMVMYSKIFLTSPFSAFLIVDGGVGVCVGGVGDGDGAVIFLTWNGTNPRDVGNRLKSVEFWLCIQILCPPLFASSIIEDKVPIVI
jgi:hypothetical protein